MHTLRMLSIAAAIAAASLAPQPVAAQDCATVCSECPVGVGYEGTGFDPKGRYNMTCFHLVPHCVGCPEVELVSEYAESADALAKGFQEMRISAYATLVNRARERLLLSVERQALVILGTSCDREAMAGVVFLSKAQFAELARLNVRPISSGMATT